jgi:hypothetical protein
MFEVAARSKCSPEALRAFVRWLAELDAKEYLRELADNQKATAPSYPETTQANAAQCAT